MADLAVYKVDEYKDEYFKSFAGLYNDFKINAASKYNFELEPLTYEDFIKAVKSGYIKCLILFEQGFPTAFTVFTDCISESVELNIIHTISDEDRKSKVLLLIQNFLEVTENERKEKCVAYPLTGIQQDLMPYLSEFGFLSVNRSVMTFDFSNDNPHEILNGNLKNLPEGFVITTWNSNMTEQAVNIIKECFAPATDSLFDPRFLTNSGVFDIISKITGDIYGKFLPDCTSVIFKDNEMAGICFVNLTNSEIANVPLLAVSEKFRGNSLASVMLQNSLFKVFSKVKEGSNIKRINATCDTDMLAAYKTYLSAGFAETDFYKQSYKLPEIAPSDFSDKEKFFG